MKYYTLRCDPDKFWSTDQTKDDNLMHLVGSRLLTPEWIPPTYTIDAHGKQGDFVCVFGEGVSALSERAAEALRPLFDSTVELLPLQTKIGRGKLGRLFALNVSRSIDCLDRDRSNVMLRADGSVYEVFKFVPRRDVKIDVHFFRTPYTRGDIVYSDAVQKVINGEKLTGLRPAEVLFSM